MTYKGDYLAGAVVRHQFNTEDSTGAPFTLAGTPAVKVYKNGDAASEVTTGVTLTVDFDSTTGSHFLSVDTSSDASFYSPGAEFSAKITSGTVNGISVVGKWLCSWSIRNRAGVIAPNGRGTATAAGASTITLQYALGANNRAYCCTIAIVGGTGVGQERVIVGYVNSTQVATVDRAWDTALDTTSQYEITTTQVPAMSSGQGFIFGVASTLNAKLVSFDTGVLDQIAAAVWNALIAGISTANSMGKYILDTLASIATLVGSGSGANTVTITVRDGSAVAIQNATVSAWSGSSLAGTSTTNASGVTSPALSLDNGTYTINITAGGFNGSSASLVVSGATAHTYTLTALTITPSDPPFVTGYLVTRVAGVATAGIEVAVAMTRTASGETGSAYLGTDITVTSDGSGIATFNNLSAGATYRIRMTVSGIEWASSFVADDTTFEIKSFVG